jgi:hypothetical protein
VGWKISESVTVIGSFFGLVGCYRRFIRVFNKLANPMTMLLEKRKEFKWTLACQDNFTHLKFKLMSPLVLVMLDLQKGFDIYCDASRQGLGCVLMQEGISYPTHPAS